MKSGTQNHLKTKRLKRLLKRPLYQVVGILETLWLLCIDCCDEGNIGKFTDEEIADYLEWDGSASELVRHLSDSGWTDTDEQGRPVIHDWLENCPEYIRDRVRKRRMRESKVRPQRTYGTKRRTKSDKVGQRPSLSDHVPSLPNPTQPNPIIHSSAENGGMNERTNGVLKSDWDAVADELARIDAFAWEKAIKSAQANNCTPGHIMALVKHGLANGYEAKGIVHRIFMARQTLDVAKGWPVPPPEAVRAESAAREKLNRQLHLHREAEATALIKAGKKAGKSEDEIRAELKAKGLEWPE